MMFEFYYLKRYVLLFLFSFCALFVYAQQNIPSYVPSSGLVGWWPFTGNAIDSSGNGNNGTVNGATLTSDRFGNASKAYSFNGISNTINVLNSSSLSSNINTISINKPSVEYVSDLRCLPPEISTGEFSFNPFFTQI